MFTPPGVHSCSHKLKIHKYNLHSNTTYRKSPRKPKIETYACIGLYIQGWGRGVYSYNFTGAHTDTDMQVRLCARKRTHTPEHFRSTAITNLVTERVSVTLKEMSPHLV